MAKKRRRGEFNMAEEFRNIIGSNRSIKFSEALEALREKHPGRSINENSASQAFYQARQKVLGKRRGKKKVVKKKTARRAATKKKAARRGAAALTAHDLIEAKQLADELGGIAQARKALEALEQLR